MFARKSVSTSVWNRRLITTLVLVWVVSVLACYGFLTDYSTRAANPLRVPAPMSVAWPADSKILLDDSRANLLVFLHPRCPCSQSTITELAEAMASHHGQVTVTSVLFMPSHQSPAWIQTSLSNKCKKLLRSHHFADLDASEAKRFGVTTSGHVLLFGPKGQCLYSGGVTAGRGHEGDNYGASSLTEILADLSSGHTPQAAHKVSRFPVFGCPIRSGQVRGRVEEGAAG